MRTLGSPFRHLAAVVITAITLTTRIALPVEPSIPAKLPTAEASKQAPRALVRESYGRLPLSFEINQGQTAPQVRFLSHGDGYGLFLMPTEAVMCFEIPAQKERKRPLAARHPAFVLRMKLAGASANSEADGNGPLTGKTNYFVGSDPKKWRTNIPNYARVRYRDVYPGVDLVYHGNQGQLEYDFVIAAGADPSPIRLAFEGALRIKLDRWGNLVLHTPVGEIVHRMPVVWQELGSERKEIAGRYVRKGRNQVGFAIKSYDARARLVIDPVLVYSAGLGRSGIDAGSSVAVDSAGNAYVTGTTVSTGFPTTPGALQTAFGGGTSDAFVKKLNAAGTAFVYSTYLGGSGADAGSSVAVDSAGNAYVAGATDSTNFPTTPGALQTAFGGGRADAFVTKLNAAGTALVYSTYLGGSDADLAHSIALDAAGSAYLTGLTSSVDFRTTAGALQTAFGGGGPFHAGDAFVTKLDPAGAALAYSTYLGGKGEDEGLGIAVDSAGSAYVTGRTDSTNFPTSRGAFRTVGGGQPFDDGYAFVTKLDARGTAAVYSTYLARMFDYTALGIAVDSAGNAYVAGNTPSNDFVPNGFVATPGAFQTAFAGGRADGYVMKLNSAGTALVYSTYLGGNDEDGAQSIALDSAGNAYVTGYTLSKNFPATPGTFDTSGSFVAAVNSTGTALVYSVYLADVVSIAVDSASSAYVTGGASVAKIGLQTGPPGPSFQAAGAVNAASFLAGPVAPGEIVTLFGTGFGSPALAPLQLNSAGLVDTTLAGTRVLFDDVPAPLVYVVANQLSAIVPYEVISGESTRVQIESRGTRSAPVTLAVARASPAIFTQASSGKGQGAILNQDFSINSAENSASIGSIVSIYATGEGQTNPAGVDGSLATAVLPKPLAAVSVKIGGVAAEVQYAGAAPGEVAGVLQVNAKVPASIAVGSAVPVSITVGDATSPAGVTMAIR